MIGALMDMTERKRAEEQLQKSEERFRRIVETSFEGICVVDANARITFTNWRMAAMLGYVIEELAGQTVFDFVDEHSREEARKRFKRRSQGISEQFDLCFRRKDGSELWVIINATPIFDAAGVFQGALGMMTDITERKQAESSLQQLTARLLQLQDEERRRIARELHDTTAQNLAALAMSLSCLKTAVPAFEPRAEKALADSLAMAEKCSQEIRTISYLLHPPLLDEVGLLVALRDYVKGFSRRSNIGVDLVLPPQLVRLPREVETALFRIVQESLGNIHRHSGSSTAVIQLQATPSEVQLEIRDAGHGMLADERNAAMTGPASFSALGVGITGMRERMQQLRGRLEIRSTSEGTLIKAILPLQQAIA
ncbi:MAG TPA: PAS domain S-box protein [Anaerolineales bacterium]